MDCAGKINSQARLPQITMAKPNLQKTEAFGINSFILRLMAILATIACYIRVYLGVGPEFFEYLNWFAFPIFAFLLAEGFEKSSDRYLYLRRIFIFAMISEIPFNYMVSGSFLNTDSQNVLFTLLAGGICIYLAETVRLETNNLFITIGSEILLCLLAWRIGGLLSLEMSGYGILIVMVFYISEKITYPKLFMAVFLGILSFYMKTDAHIIISFWGMSIALNEISTSIPAMIAIWLYNGKRGPNSNSFKLIFYLFYPILLTIIAIIKHSIA